MEILVAIPIVGVGMYIIVYAIPLVLIVIGLMKIFKKAEVPCWKAFIPVYSGKISEKETIRGQEG
jgi:hypothetical protein